MQSDEVVWQIVNHGQCSYKVKNTVQSFCRNKYNISGFCNRVFCPLANSQYATVLEVKGKLVLYMKSAERAHLPAKLWEHVSLDKNYELALQQVTENLEHWPKVVVHKVKQRLTKLTQYLIRQKKIVKRARQKVTTLPARHVQREKQREAKAQVAARLESSIEKQLLDRLTMSTYDNVHSHTNAHNSTQHTQRNGIDRSRSALVELEYEHAS